jgi:hypothetical protein
MHCGVCNGHFAVIGEEKAECTTHRGQGACSNSNAISVRKLEDRVLNGLKEKLLASELLAEFVRYFHRELNRYEREEARQRETAQVSLKDIDAKIARMVGAVEDGAEIAAYRTRLVGRITA